MFSIGVLFYSIFIISENLLSMKGKSKIILSNMIIASFLNILLNFILVPRYGISGAAFSTMFSYIFWSILSLVRAKKHTLITPLKKDMLKVILVGIISAGILILVKQFFPINLISLILQGLFFLLVYFFLILFTRCLDKNDIMILKAIKNKILKK